MSEERPSSRATLLVAAVALVLVDRFVPHGQLALYPFTLLATWVHEMGHGLAALAVGGRFEQLEIFANASGLAQVASGPGLPSAIVGLGGLLAPPFAGAVILASARGPRRARLVLFALALALGLSSAFLVRSLVGLVAMPLVMLLVFAVARYGDGPQRLFFAQLVALYLALDTLGRGLSYVFMDSVLIEGKELTSDIGGVAQALGGPRVLYSLLVAGVSLVLVAIGLWAGFRGQPVNRTGEQGERPARSG